MEHMLPNTPEQDDNEYAPQRLEWTGRENYIEDLEGTIICLEYLKGQLVEHLREILSAVAGLTGQPAEPIVNKDSARLARYGSCINEKGLHAVYEIKTGDLKTYWRITYWRNAQGDLDPRKGLTTTNVTPAFRDTLDN